jgi:DNA polymerase III epsilon subunit family exonuclease
VKSSTLRLLQLWLACTLVCAGIVVAVALALYAALPPVQRTAARSLLESTGTLPPIVAIVAVAILGFLAVWLNSHYFVALAATAEAASAALHTTSAQPLPAQGPAEMRAVIAALNALMLRNRSAMREIDARVAEAQHTLESERNTLAVLMAQLPQGVIVANSEGTVLLYNEQARHLLCPPQSGRYLGLGRSVYNVVPGETLQGAIARLIVSDACGEIDPLVEINVPFPTEAPLRIRVAPVAGIEIRTDASHSRTRPAGFVLLIETAEAVHPSSEEVRTMAADRPSLSARPVFYDFELFHRTAPAEFVENRLLKELAYTAFDTETTGLDPSAGDEIIAIGAVRVVNARIVSGEQFDCLIDPDRSIDPAAAAVHGLTDATLRGQPRIGAVLPAFHGFCADTVLLGHNVAFDLRFLQLKEQATGVRFHQPVLDTLVLASLLQEHSGDNRLEAIAHRYGLEVVGRHTALGDALITAEVFLKMLPQLEGRGIVTLGQALEASRRSKYAGLRY